MLQGFEEQTAPLSDYEQTEVLPVVLTGLSKKIGVQNAVTSDVMIQALTERGLKVSGPRIRKVINFIRNENLIPGLVSSSKGYWVSDDPEEIKTWIESLRGREQAIRLIRHRAESFLNELLIKKVNRY